MTAGADRYPTRGELVLVPCLNDHPAWVAALAQLCRETTAGT